MQLCEKCDGTGRISCGACWNGQRKPVCPECTGKGVIRTEYGDLPCPRCRGNGEVTPVSCPHCGNSTPCPVCKGSGAV